MALIEIKNRFTNSVLFSHESEENTLKITLLMAIKANANLYGANLCGANLRSADLYGADLCGADLYGADLRGADLCGADLRGANLCGADLRDANLCGDRKLIGDRPFMQIGPIGSRSDYLIAHITDKGLMLRAGCFFGSVDAFELALDAEYGNNNHAKEYRAALALIDKHAELWTPSEEVKASA